jgi:hypothetical protein
MVPGNSEAMDHLCVHDLVNEILVHVLVNINSKKGVDRLQNGVNRLGCWGQGVVENVEFLGYNISILSSQNGPPMRFLPT